MIRNKCNINDRNEIETNICMLVTYLEQTDCKETKFYCVCKISACD